MEENKMEEFYQAWEYINNCEGLCGNGFLQHDTIVVKVNPVTDVVDNDESKNTKVQVWIEVFTPDSITHIYDLDCGGDTYEDAIIELARLIKEKKAKKIKESELEKLSELLEQARDAAMNAVGSLNEGFGKWYANYLLNHGVTIKKESVE